MREEWQKWHESASPSLVKFEQEYHHFIKPKLDPIFGSTRDTQLQKVDIDASERPLSPYERKINRNLGMSTAIIGDAFVTAPLGPLVQLGVTAPLALYVVKDIYKAAYDSLV